LVFDNIAGDAMKSIFGCRGIAACALVFLAACATAPRWEKYAAPPTGTTWTNQFRYAGSYRGPAEVDSRMGRIMWDGRMHIAFHNGGSTLVAREDGTWVTVIGPDGRQVTSWDPPPPLSWPLEVGKTWKSSFKVVNHATGASVPVEATYVIEAHEDVTVPAGTFKVFRMRMTSNTGEDNTWWFSQENGLFIKQRLVRTDKAPQGPGVREGELKALAIAK
jgi:hypothetical protein